MKVDYFSGRFVLVFIIFSILGPVFSVESDCQARSRSEVKIPNISGYVIVKCDFHMHSVFSDGEVWPSVRAEEAWRAGLDAFSVTDHIEYHPKKDDIPINHNRGYETARPKAEALNLTVIKGAEITRSMPPGHINAIFLKDANSLDTKEWKDAVKAAVEQGAFVFWNHPGWIDQQPEGKSVWYDEHTELYEKGWMHGIEIINGNEYYPIAHKLALEKRLALLGNSDVHGPIQLDYDLSGGGHRPMTLVLAREKTKESIKEALLSQRTIVYWKNILIGEEKYLKPIFKESIEIINPDVTIKGQGGVYIQIRNKSEIDFELAADGTPEEIFVPQSITLKAGKTILLRIKGKSEDLSGRRKIHMPYKVENLWVAPSEGLREELIININFISVEKD